MSTTLDVAICLDRSLSMANCLNSVCQSLISLGDTLLVYPNIRFSLIEFGTYGDPFSIRTQPFTSSNIEFQQWIDNVRLEQTYSIEAKAIGRALAVSQRLDWYHKVDNTGRDHENLVILITDGPPNGLLTNDYIDRGQYIWRMANEFVQDDIVLLVAGIEPTVVVCEDFYCALANQTGGEYIPFNNVVRIFPSIIQKYMEEGDTLSQIFRHLDMKFDIEYNSLYCHRYIEKRVRFMIEHCSKMAQIRQEFRHTEASRNVINENIDDDDYDEEDRVSYYRFPGYYNEHVFSFEYMNDSTPQTDDEGYRSRLLTATSPESSYQNINSPIFLQVSDDDPTSEIEL